MTEGARMSEIYISRLRAHEIKTNERGNKNFEINGQGSSEKVGDSDLSTTLCRDISKKLRLGTINTLSKSKIYDVGTSPQRYSQDPNI